MSQIWRRPATTPSSAVFHSPLKYFTAKFSTDAADDVPAGVPFDEMPFLHHKKRPRYRDYVKFKSPRKRASGLLTELQKETVQKSKEAKPEVFGTEFSVGDSIELQVIEQGGVGSSEKRKVRGVVIAKYNKGMDTSVLIRDVLFGTPVERLLPLHSPLVKSLRLLEKNFVYKGRRKVKRAKLYFLRERNDNESRVTKGKN
jgi:large subunit ribosomal protein L19